MEITLNKTGVKYAAITVALFVFGLIMLVFHPIVLLCIVAVSGVTVICGGLVYEAYLAGEAEDRYRKNRKEVKYED